LPFSLDLGEDIKVYVPKLGDKKKILDLSTRNAKYSRQEKIKQTKLVDPERHANRILSQLQKDLNLSKLPTHMECFDNSNIQGTNPVAACVVFKDAKPSKADYRQFNIKTVEGPDDYASMEEVVFRRYKRLLQEGENLPQLIVIDGGKGQLSSAVKSLDLLGLRGKIAIIGIAKRLEEIYYPEDPVPLYLDKSSESLKLIQFMRNEAHRFGIRFHRNKRSKSAINSSLNEIIGVGDKTVEKLFQDFRSISKIKNASLEELTESIGLSKAQLVKKSFSNEEVI
jgi:excinuclease ABC subunit C